MEVLFLSLALRLCLRRRGWLPRPPGVRSEPHLVDFDLRALPMSSLRTYRLPTSRFVADHVSSDLITLNFPSDISRCLTFIRNVIFFNNSQLRPSSFFITAKMANLSVIDVQDISPLIGLLLITSLMLMRQRSVLDQYQLIVFSKQSKINAGLPESASNLRRII